MLEQQNTKVSLHAYNDVRKIDSKSTMFM